VPFPSSSCRFGLEDRPRERAPDHCRCHSPFADPLFSAPSWPEKLDPGPFGNQTRLVFKSSQGLPPPPFEQDMNPSWHVVEFDLDRFPTVARAQNRFVDRVLPICFQSGVSNGFSGRIEPTGKYGTQEYYLSPDLSLLCQDLIVEYFARPCAEPLRDDWLWPVL